MSVVLIARVQDDLPVVVDRILDDFAGDLEGKVVLVKPNILAPFPPEKGVTTRPAVVEAVVRAALARGAEVMVGDNPGGVDRSSYQTALAAGIVDASLGCFRNLSEQVVEVKTSSRFVSSFLVSRAFLEADYLIDLPCLKTHALTMLTGAVKNMFGMVAGTQKARLHLAAPTRNRFSELLVDLYQVRPPDLVIMDALWAMEGNGPTHGQLRRLDTILAGTDGVAVDATAARMVGFDPAEIRHLVVAAERGLGQIAADRIEVRGPFQVVPDFRPPAGFTASPEEQGRILATMGNLKPVLRAESCVQCGDCAASCPPRAITLNPYPEVGEGCISCYCCVELCAEGAMEVPEGETVRLWDRMFGGGPAREE